MLLFKKIASLQPFIKQYKSHGGSVGFVPTMGALHAGHLSLIEQARENCDWVICSIFVNPTQFNDASDLEKYPRTLKQDIDLLVSAGTDALFCPSVEEVYPPGLATNLKLDLGQLDQVMEGEFRPGHFAGVAQVVKRLLDIVQPDALFMGQKDFQQFTIIDEMIRQLQLPVRLVMCPIVREADQLAMSSRNRRLKPEIRSRATVLHETLTWAKKNRSSLTPEEIKESAMKRLAIPDFRPEYFEIVEGHTLQPIKKWEEHDYIVACTAVWAGEVRLIDNLVLSQ